MRTRAVVLWMVALAFIAVPALRAQDAGPAAPALPAPRTVVINEVELNPNGFDRDAEWVELLNVGSTAVDLAGWTLSYDYPVDGALVIAAESRTLQPGQRWVFAYPGLRLRNDDTIVVRLADASGAVVDETNALRDVYDDAKTWQRIPDGGDPTLPIWLLRDGTKNAPNK